MAFRLNCLSKLYKDLGRYDAIVEFTEIAIRDFENRIPTETQFDVFLQQKSREHNIKVDSVDQNIFRSRISQSYILSVYQNAELFIHSFRSEYNDLFATSWSLDDTKENLLIKSLRKVIPINRAKKEIGEYRLEIFDYYRVVRNKYSHEIIKDKKVDKAFKEVSLFNELICDVYPKLNAPNQFNEICFDDFILFTRTFKDIAKIMCEIITPEKEIFIDYYKRKKLFTNLNENLTRKNNAIKGHIQSNFGLSGEITTDIIKGINASLA